MIHQPVLEKEIIGLLSPRANNNFIDATVGGGGHARAILKKTAPYGKVLGLDRDPELIARLKKEAEEEGIDSRLVLINSNFKNLKRVVVAENFFPINGILFDLGMSSWHLDKSNRGFSFQKNEPLDMRFNPEKLERSTAAEIVNKWSEANIKRTLEEYGGEKFAKEIAREIVFARKKKIIATTAELVEIIEKAVTESYRRKRIHFATKTFQALRIAVNDELNSISGGLENALEIMPKGARIAVISFHSLEDRLVKIFLKNACWQVLTKKPVRPSAAEIKTNPRARSARLRAAVKK